jgi:hypothetical protein
MDSPIQTDGHLLWEITIFHGKTHYKSPFLMGISCDILGKDMTLGYGSVPGPTWTIPTWITDGFLHHGRHSKFGANKHGNHLRQT